MGQQPKRFRGFISYSQRNRAIARRLHRRLERYRLPKGLTVDGIDPKTRRIGRFFRDDDELAASPELGAAIRGAIEDSESLIVICSPDAARSKWVNREILAFRRLVRGDQIFAITVAGQPDSENPADRCFPSALRATDAVEGEVPIEPLAIDLRRDGGARCLARVVAGLLSINFDDLWRRERRRRTVRAMALMVAGVVAMAGIAATWSVVDHRSRIDRLALEAQELIERRLYSTPGRAASNEPLIGQRRIFEALPFAIAALPVGGDFFVYAGQSRDCGSFGRQPAARCAGLRLAFALPEASRSKPKGDADSAFAGFGSTAEAEQFVSESTCSLPNGARPIRLWELDNEAGHIVSFEVDDGSDYGVNSYALSRNDGKGCVVAPVQHRRYIAAADFEPTTNAVVTASGDNNIVVWYVNQEADLDVFSHGWHVRDADFLGPSQVVTQTESGDVWVWDTAIDAEIYRLNGTQDEKGWYEIDPDGSVTIFRRRPDRRVEAFSLNDGRALSNSSLRRTLCERLASLQGEAASRAIRSVEKLQKDPCPPGSQ